ncbi:MAG TPA: hypothetical protein DD727_07055 [Clostridiales bacterium]|nr:hypothetical protein [Clostridiales bacterium]
MENRHNPILPVVMNGIRFDILEHGHLKADSSWHHLNVNSPFNRLYLVTAGEGAIRNAHQSIRLLPGHAYLIPTHTPYDYICEESLEKYYIHFSLGLLQQDDLLDGLDSCITSPVDLDEMRVFLRLSESRNIVELMHFKSYLFRIVCDLLVPVLPEIEADIDIWLKYRLFYQILAHRCTAELKISDIAGSMGIPAPTLSKNFKRDTGKTLKSVLAQRLARQSMELVLLSDSSIKEIAYRLCFRDEFYFSRFFKKHTGLSPREYRKQNSIFKSGGQGTAI